MKIEWWELISKAVWWGWIKVWQIRSARTSMSVVLFTYVTCNVRFFLKVLPPFVFPYLSVFVLIYFYPRTCPVQTKAWSSILPLISQGNRMPLFFIHACTMQTCLSGAGICEHSKFDFVFLRLGPKSDLIYLHEPLISKIYLIDPVTRNQGCMLALPLT